MRSFPRFPHPDDNLLTHEFAPFRGGIATYVRETAHAAALLGLPVKIIAPDYGLAAQPADQKELFAISRVPNNGRLTPAGIWSLARALASRREEIQDAEKIVLLSPGALMAMILAREMKWIRAASPVITFFHGSEVLRFSRHSIWRRLSSRFFPQTQPACASHFVERLIREKRLFAEGVKIIRAPCGCPADIVVAADQRVNITGSLQDSYNSTEFLTLARLHPRKGQLQTARAFGFLPSKMKRRVKYLMAGDGARSYRDQVERACLAADIRHEFRAMASPDERSSIYAACDVFVMTSVRLPESVEGFGISYLEASIHAKPILAFRTGGVEEAVVHDRTGLLVDEGDLAGLAAAMQRLMEDADLRRRLGAGGREFALGFSWNNAARALCAE